ncbi:hypothetical protein RvY_00707 [Ramazzottius varieornatus]|uniref:Uncharacterized protein n=1 Tax=Ramazzottius varieornatus TaxID=947166 RepID=A0A1D1UEL2_RAMVA|nr:hypothetical protein RvY_00707 [Ramazzottius varieornatus]
MVALPLGNCILVRSHSRTIAVTATFSTLPGYTLLDMHAARQRNIKPGSPSQDRKVAGNGSEQFFVAGWQSWHRYKNRRACPGEAYEPTEVEHVANIFTHAISIVPALCGTAYLVSLSRSSAQTLAAIVYGLSLVALFGMSTAFHCSCYYACESKTKFRLHICDRATIFIFIGCSYTPWLLLRETEPVYAGFLTLTVLWLMVAGGILYQLKYHEKNKHLETLIYLFIGLTPAAAIIPSMLDHRSLWNLAQGGAVYVVGLVFFKCDGIVPFAHAIWHLFVVLGASIQYFAVVHHLYPSEASTS